MTPTRKGLYEQCSDCTFKEANSLKKYPCRYSHAAIRKAAEVKYEKDFKECKLYKQKELNV